jgi:hypothetical protein
MECLQPARGKKKAVSRDRTMDEFRAVAVDIWGQRTSKKDAYERPNWESIVDVQDGESGVLSDGSDVEIWYMALAKT